MFTDERHKTDLNHECELSLENDVIARYIDSGSFVVLRRQFRKIMLINETNPRSRAFYKSSFIITREKLFHLNYHYYIIHPFSQFREVWDFFQVIFISVQLSLNPIGLLAQIMTPRYVEIVLDFTTIADMCMAFNTGYVDNQENCIVLCRRLLIKRYLLTLFILDLISFINLKYIHAIQLGYWPKLDSNLPEERFVQLINITKWARFFVLWIYLNRLKESRQINMFVMGGIKLVLSLILLALWMTALSYIIGISKIVTQTNDDWNRFEAHVQALQHSICILFQFGPVLDPDSMCNMLFQMVCLLLGFIINFLILCKMMQSGTKFIASQKYSQSVKQLNEYLRYKSIPPGLVTKILKYYDFRYEINFYNEDTIMQIIGPQLQQEVMLQIHMHLFSKLDLFQLIPLNILYGIIKTMKVMYFMPSDVILMAGGKSKALYFIRLGSVAAYSLAGKEVKHYSEDEHFGELSFMGDNRQSPDTIIAIDCCEIYVLKRKYFISEIEQHPEIHSKVTDFMNEYLSRYYHADLEMYEDAPTHNTL